jgi:hypothetical protein
MKEIILQSEFPCLVVSEKQEVFISPEDKLKINDEEIYIYPVGDRQFSFKIDLACKNSKKYRFYETEENLYCFLLSNKIISKKVVHKQKINQKEIKLVIGSREITYQTDNEELCVPVEMQIGEYSCFTIENFSCIKLKNKNKEIIYLYNPEDSKLKIYKGNDFKIEKKEITFKHQFSDVASTITKKKLIFDKNSIKEEIIENNFASNYQITTQTICYAFLDCVLQKNYVLAKKFLHNNFSSITDEQFSEFFGEYYKFFPIDYNKFILIYNNENKIITFSVDENLILDFEI